MDPLLTKLMFITKLPFLSSSVSLHLFQLLFLATIAPFLPMVRPVQGKPGPWKGPIIMTLSLKDSYPELSMAFLIKYDKAIKVLSSLSDAHMFKSTTKKYSTSSIVNLSLSSFQSQARNQRRQNERRFHSKLYRNSCWLPITNAQSHEQRLPKQKSRIHRHERTFFSQSLPFHHSRITKAHKKRLNQAKPFVFC